MKGKATNKTGQKLPSWGYKKGYISLDRLRHVVLLDLIVPRKDALGTPETVNPIGNIE
jgi:hypothetical protein